MSESKILGTIELKDDGEEGAFSATFATLAPAVDKDGDVTLPGAFRDGTKTVIGAFNHSSQRGDALPVGIATIRSNASRAWVEGTFFDTPAGRTYRTTLKQLGPLTEWSYSYVVDNQSTDYSELRAWPGAKRILKAISVFGVSPVLRGAGVATRTDWVKGDGLVALDELIDERTQRLMGGADDELYRIWEHLEAERRGSLLNLDDLSFI